MCRQVKIEPHVVFFMDGNGKILKGVSAIHFPSPPHRCRCRRRVISSCGGAGWIGPRVTCLLLGGRVFLP
jgi:hypothetical protein